MSGDYIDVDFYILGCMASTAIYQFAARRFLDRIVGSSFRRDVAGFAVFIVLLTVFMTAAHFAALAFNKQ